jgi:HK97 family phage major capsid protein
MGIVIPTQFDQNIRAVTPQTAIIRPRALVIPAGDPPDAPFQMVALDQGGSKGVYAGVLMKWIGENSARTGAGDPQVVLITVQPNLLQGYIDVSDMLLRNAPAMEAFLTDRMRLACIGAEDSSFFTGNGVKKPLGPIGHGSAIKVKRNTASKIKYADLVKMMASFMFGNQPVWVASQSCLEELMLMEDTEGHLIWQPSAREGMPNTLLGYPVIFSQRSPRLGSNGDLALMDFKYYCIKDGSGLAIFMDPYTQKANGLTRIYVMFMVDGQPMINSPLLSENGVDKISPFVTLE